MSEPLDPHNTILVIKYAGREVGRIAATAQNAEAYIQELTSFYGSVEVDYVKDENGWLLAALQGRRSR